MNNRPQSYVLSLLTLLTAATASLSLFIKVAEEVLEGDTHRIDQWLILFLREPGRPTDPWGPLWLEDFVRDITALGSPVVLGLFVMTAVVFFLLIDNKRMALFMLLAAGGGTLVVTALKEAFARPRPEWSPDGLFVYTASFPSGHAMVSAVVYLTLGVLIARLAPNIMVKLYIMAVAALLTGLVGFSRIYLGAHWPSDVLAGWAIGAAWAAAGGFLAQILKLDRENTE